MRPDLDSSSWSAERVLALAADAPSARAAQGLARASAWSGTGVSERAIWGLCQGSRAEPYRTAVELGGPAYRCSCPSRKVPCKHALALLLLWSAGAVVPADEPPWVADLGRADPSRPAARSAKVADPAAAQARAARRADRVSAGVAELQTWLADRVRRGLAGFELQGYTELNRMAARMVDAQAPGLAGSLRRAAATVGRGHGWPGRLLEELAMVHLTAQAHDRLGELPGPLAETVRSRIGWTTDTARVQAGGERVDDTWLVLGRVLELDERLTTRRIWLRGLRSARTALLLTFTPTGSALPASPAGPGEPITATATFYPAAIPLRALLTPTDPPDPAPPADQPTATEPATAADQPTTSPTPLDGHAAPAPAPPTDQAAAVPPPTDPPDLAGDPAPAPPPTTDQAPGPTPPAHQAAAGPAVPTNRAAAGSAARTHQNPASAATPTDQAAAGSAAGVGVHVAARLLGVGVGAALGSYAEALAVDPWLERWPVLLRDVRPARHGDGWAVVDEDGDGLELTPYTDPWPLLALSAGKPITVAGEWSRAGLLPMTCWRDGRPVALT